MMSRKIQFLITILCALSLTGCVSREQADEKLAKGCAAGISALLPEGETLGNITAKKFTASPDGPNMRHVDLTVKREDGWIEEDVAYECTFEESFGFMSKNFTASLYQLRIGDQVYGKAGNQILGDAQDFIKLTDAIRAAMYE
jgi:hypothetical protein